jgi:hypothetical protein
MGGEWAGNAGDNKRRIEKLSERFNVFTRSVFLSDASKTDCDRWIGVEPTRPCDQRILSPGKDFSSSFPIKCLQELTRGERGIPSPSFPVLPQRTAIVQP